VRTAGRLQRSAPRRCFALLESLEIPRPVRRQAAGESKSRLAGVRASRLIRFEVIPEPDSCPIDERVRTPVAAGDSTALREFRGLERIRSVEAGFQLQLPGRCVILALKPHSVMRIAIHSTPTPCRGVISPNGDDPAQSRARSTGSYFLEKTGPWAGF
jgi:hypothetical protein